jgi:arylsulfatase
VDVFDHALDALLVPANFIRVSSGAEFTMKGDYRMAQPLKSLGAVMSRVLTVSLLSVLGITLTHAQETSGVAGSPGATTTIDGRYLPPPPQRFQGEINLNAAQSKPAWPARVMPPKGAPNVLLIMTDDVGFGAPSTFGGVIPTPTLDRIAANGLRYTNFHSTALCSPTRAALITGRNHHSVGFGVISEISTGFPGYNSIIPKNSATIGRILQENGYRTSWFGKEHNTPTYQASQAGPFDQWPIGMGFDYFYGFIGGDTVSGSRTSSAIPRRFIPMSGIRAGI